MTELDMGPDTAQATDDIAWRHFWLASVVVETDGRPPVRAFRRELRPRRESLSRRLQRLRHMRAILDAPRH